LEHLVFYLFLLHKNIKVELFINDFKGFAKERPFMSAILTIFLFSLAGIPSTIGFIAKFYVFVGAIEANYTILAGAWSISYICINLLLL